MGKRSNKGVPLLGERPIPDQIVYIATKVEQHDDHFKLLGEKVDQLDEDLKCLRGIVEEQGKRIDRMFDEFRNEFRMMRSELTSTQNILRGYKLETDEEIGRLKKAVFVN